MLVLSKISEKQFNFLADLTSEFLSFESQGLNDLWTWANKCADSLFLSFTDVVVWIIFDDKYKFLKKKKLGWAWLLMTKFVIKFQVLKLMVKWINKQLTISPYSYLVTCLNLTLNSQSICYSTLKKNFKCLSESSWTVVCLCQNSSFHLLFSSVVRTCSLALVL